MKTTHSPKTFGAFIGQSTNTLQRWGREKRAAKHLARGLPDATHGADLHAVCRCFHRNQRCENIYIHLERHMVQYVNLGQKERMYPIEMVHVQGIGEVPAPLIRLSTCGMMTIEVLLEVVRTDPWQGRYIVLSAQHLRGRGISSALTLLKLLICRPHRFASRDWLVEHVRQREDEVDPSRVRLDNIVSQLRTLLVENLPGQISVEHLGGHLVLYQRTGRASGPGYQLAGYPLIWLDTDAIAWHVEQGALCEQGSDDPLPLWEHAYQLAAQGPFLCDEPYSDWAENRRQEVTGHLRQCVQALYRHTLTRYGERGEERAL